MKREKIFVILFLSVFILSLSVVKAELTAQALDAVIKDNNEQLKTSLINIQTQHKNEIVSILQGEEFKNFIKEQIGGNLKEERIKISISVFVSILLALIVFSWINFGLSLKKKEVEKIRELKKEEDRIKKEQQIKFVEEMKLKEQEAKENLFREEAEKLKQKEIERAKEEDERKLKLIEEKKLKIMEMKKELDRELESIGR